MKRQFALLGLGAVLVAGGVLIWKLTRPATETRVTVNKPANVATPGPTPTIAATPQTSTPIDAAPVAADQPVVTVHDGVEIRDHRTDKSIPVTDFPKATFPGGRTLADATVHAAYGSVQPKVDACLAKLDKSTFGDKAGLNLQMIVEVKGGTLSVTRVTPPAFRNVSGDTSAVATCLSSALAGATAKASDGDIAEYPISIAMPLGTAAAPAGK